MGSTGLTHIAEGDLDIDPTTGTLYGIQDWPAGRNLFSINPATGQATTIGTMENSDVSAMAFSATGTLYVLETSTDRLLTVNKATGATLTAVPLSVNLGALAGMDFDPTTGALYVTDSGATTGGTNKLYTLNPATGQLTLVGATGLSGDALCGLGFLAPGARRTACHPL